MDPATQLDAAARRRSLATLTLPGYRSGRAPQNKGRSYPADPPRVEEIVAVMRQAGERPADCAFEDWESSLGEPVFGSARLWRSPRETSSPGAERCSSAMARVASAARLGWTIGDGGSLIPG